MLGPRLRASAGLAVLVTAAAGLAMWGPAGLVSWLPLFALVSVVGSTLVHEGAHAWAAHNLGYRVEWVVLGGLTGVTAYYGRDDRPLEHQRRGTRGDGIGDMVMAVVMCTGHRHEHIAGPDVA